MPRWTTSAVRVDETELPDPRRRRDPRHDRAVTQSYRRAFPGIRTGESLWSAAGDLALRPRARGVDRETDLAAAHRERGIGRPHPGRLDADGDEVATAPGHFRAGAIHPGAGSGHQR